MMANEGGWVGVFLIPCCKGWINFSHEKSSIRVNRSCLCLIKMILPVAALDVENSGINLMSVF